MGNRYVLLGLIAAIDRGQPNIAITLLEITGVWTMLKMCM